MQNKVRENCCLPHDNIFHSEKLDELECLTERPSLSRRHHVLGAQGYELLALGLQSYDNVSDLSGSRLEQKFLDCTGIRKLNKQEVGL